MCIVARQYEAFCVDQLNMQICPQILTRKPGTAKFANFAKFLLLHL